MKLVIRFVCILIPFLVTNYSDAFSSYRLIEAPNGKLILILGDVHIPEAKSRAQSLVEALKKAGIGSPLNIIVESKGIVDEAIINSEPIKALHMMAKSYKAKTECPIRLSYCEPRGPMSDLLELFRNVLNTCFETVMANSETSMLEVHEGDTKTSQNEEDWVEWNKKKNLLYASRIFVKGGTKCTVKTFTNYLEANLELLKEFADRYKNTDYKNIFDAIVQGYSGSITTIKKRFAKGDKHRKLMELFLEDITACTTPSSLKEWVHSWTTLYLGDCDYVVFDAAILDRMCATFDDRSPLCVVIGEAHAVKCSSFLTKVLQWKLLDAEQIAEDMVKQPHKQITGVFDERLMGAVERVLEPLFIRCAVCSKTEQVKACSICKDVYYCGADCQKKAWKDHKQVCKKVTIKV